MPEYETEDYATTQENRFDQDNLIKQIKELLGEKDYDLFILRMYYGLSYQEISDMTGETIAALTNRYHRAQKKVKKDIKL